MVQVGRIECKGQAVRDGEPAIAVVRRLAELSQNQAKKLFSGGKVYVESLPCLSWFQPLAEGTEVSIDTDRKNPRKLVRLSAVSYPDRLVTAIAHQMLADPHSRFRRLHFFPFGGLSRTVDWLARIAAGDFELNDDLAGFRIPG